MKLLAISGSLRAGSYNTLLLEAARQHLPQGVEWELGHIADLPLYNEDLDGDPKPEPVQRLLDQAANADALVIASPEYNYGVPGGLKNAIDWLSRPAYKSVLAYKPTLLMSASLSPAGGVRAQGQLRQILAGTLTPVYPAPEFSLPNASSQMKDGTLTEDATITRLDRLVTGFCAWVRSSGSVGPGK